MYRYCIHPRFGFWSTHRGFEIVALIDTNSTRQSIKDGYLARLNQTKTDMQRFQQNKKQTSCTIEDIESIKREIVNHPDANSPSVRSTSAGAACSASIVPTNCSKRSFRVRALAI